MKTFKRLTTIFLALCTVICSLAVFGTADDSFIEQFNISIAVGATESELGFSWFYPAEADGRLIYAKAADLVDGKMPEDATVIEVEGVLANDLDEYSYHVDVKGLEPETEYAYQLVNNDDYDDIRTFTTGAKDEFSFVFLGDPQVDAEYEMWDNSLNIIDSRPEFDGVSFFVTGGDQVDTGRDHNDFTNYLDHEVLYKYPVATTVGDHDEQGNIYPTYFNVANMSDKYGISAAGADSYFRYNDVLFISINTNNGECGEHSDFIREVAAANTDARWRIIVQHHSFFSPIDRSFDSSFGYGESLRYQLAPVYEEVGIDMVLNGHDHSHGRTYIMDFETPIKDPAAYDDETMTSATDPDGIIYLTGNSSSGTKYYEIRPESAEYCASLVQDKSPHATRFDVTDDSLSFTTYSLNEMMVVDTFTINKTPEMSFTDVPEGQWYTEGIRYCFEKGYMAGVNELEFGRKQNVTRAMFATILAKIDGADTSSYSEMSFVDVPAGQWYSNSIEWAYRNDYAAGIGNGQFGRKADVSREQIALFFYTYSSLNDIDVTAEADLSPYSDLDRVHDWALDAVEWAVEKGLISGVGENLLAPRDPATRAEIALIIRNFAESVLAQ